MALNKEVFKTRSLTAIVFVIIMMIGLLVNKYTFVGLFTLVMFGCLYEFSKLVKLIHAKKYFFYLPIAFLYIILPVSFLIDLGINGAHVKEGYSPLLPCAILFSIWINDTMAYVVGSFIGKTPFSAISPKKTWEGTIGGALLCIGIIGVLGSLLHYTQAYTRFDWFAIAIICAVFGTLGDLFESKIKRMANVKDSGSFMPGHGGFLDRFDSLLIATPFVWIYIKLLI